MEGEVWNEREINRRSQIIADYVKQIWPHASVLRRQLGITSPQEEADGIPRLSPLMAERLVDSVTESGTDDGWANKEGLNRWRRETRYGRYIRLGGGDRWEIVWFGVSRDPRELMLDRSNAPDHSIGVLDGVGFDEVLESVTTQVREVAEAIAAGGDEG